MMEYTDTKQSPWYVVPSDDKKRSRLNRISHILSQIPYEDALPEPIELPHREDQTGYVRPPFDDQTFVPEAYWPLKLIALTSPCVKPHPSWGHQYSGKMVHL